MLAFSVLQASIMLWALPLLCMRPCIAEPEATTPCQSGTCEDGVSLMQQSNSLKKRMTTSASENEVVGEEEAPANIDLSPLRNVLKDVVSHRSKEKEGGDDKPENITIIMSLPNQFPSGLMAPGAPAAPPGMVGPAMMPPGIPMPGQPGIPPPNGIGQQSTNPASAGGVAGAADWMTGGSAGSSSGNAGRNTWGSKPSRKAPDNVLPKTTTGKPPAGSSGGSSSYGSRSNTYGSGGQIQSSVQKETEAGITAGIKAGILSSQKQITQQIAAGVQQGIQQGIKQGLAQR